MQFLIGSVLFSPHKYSSVLQRLLVPYCLSLILDRDLVEVGSKKRGKTHQNSNIVKISSFTFKSG